MTLPSSTSGREAQPPSLTFKWQTPIHHHTSHKTQWQSWSNKKKQKRTAMFSHALKGDDNLHPWSFQPMAWLQWKRKRPANTLLQDWWKNGGNSIWWHVDTFVPRSVWHWFRHVIYAFVVPGRAIFNWKPCTPLRMAQQCSIMSRVEPTNKLFNGRINFTNMSSKANEKPTKENDL